MLRDMRKGMRRRLGSLKSASEFSELVVGILRSLYRLRGPAVPVSQAVYDRGRRIVTLYAATPKAAARLSADAATIRAALRREGVDAAGVSVVD